MKITKVEILGQYFTKIEIVKDLIGLLDKYKKYSKKIKILEPSSGTGNFIKVLKELNFKKIEECEIDPKLTKEPKDFFHLNLINKYDLIVGNPPFSKYNLPDSYFYTSNYINFSVDLKLYLPEDEFIKNKIKIENAFIYKSISHLKNENSTIAYILPISFFIKNKNKQLKQKIIKHFNTIIIFQNNKVWFDRNIPCCFTILTNTKKFKNKIICIYENSKLYKNIFNVKNIFEELIPETIYHKKYSKSNNQLGTPLSQFLDKKNVKVKKSFEFNNISAKNILTKTRLRGEDINQFKLAVVRVGNSSVGKSGYININKDILNDMFYIFDFKDKYKNNKKIKELICESLNKNQDYFKNISCRVGSKSIKKEDIFNFKIII